MPPTRDWRCCRKEKIDALLTETSQAVGGLGPALQRLVDSTANLAAGFQDNLPQVNDIIANSAPILDSQVRSGDAIEQWSRNLNVFAAQAAEQDAALRSGLQQAPPTLDQLTAVFGGVRDSLPQTLANLAVVIDMLKRYNKGVEQLLVILPQGASMAQAGTIFEGLGQLPLALLDQPAAALLDRVPAGVGVAIAGRHQHAAAAEGHLLQDPKGLPGQRGSRRAQLSLRRCPWQARGDAAGVPQQRAVRAAGHQPLVRRPEPGPVLPGAGRALRPGCQSRPWGDSGADGQQRCQPDACGSVAAAVRIVAGADQRPAEPARPGHRRNAADNSPTRARTLRHQGPLGPPRSTARPAARWSDRTASGTTSAIRATQETTDGRRCWHPPAEPHRC